MENTSDDVLVIRRQAKEATVDLGYLSVWFPWSGQEDWQSLNVERFCKAFGRSFRRTDKHLMLNLGHSLLGDRTRQLWLVDACTRIYTGKLTRIDLTIDLACTFDFREYHTLMVKQWQLSQHLFGKVGLPILYDSPQGLTVYVGKRGNARLIRVYDKRAEIKAKTKDHLDIGFDLCRIELELHGRIIGYYLNLWTQEQYDTICDDIAFRYSLPVLSSNARRAVVPRDCDDPDSKWRFIERYHKCIGDCVRENPRRFYQKVRVPYETR